MPKWHVVAPLGLGLRRLGLYIYAHACMNRSMRCGYYVARDFSAGLDMLSVTVCCHALLAFTYIDGRHARDELSVQQQCVPH